MQLSKVPFSKAIESFFVASRANGISETTLRIYNWALKRMLEHIGDKPVGEITHADLAEFFAWFQPARLTTGG